MKILTIQSSARKNGNTATALGWAKEEMIKLGHEVESVSLFQKDIKGCLACAKCKEDAENIGCIQKDDAIGILEMMIQADLVVFASPLYFWGLTGPLKTLLDRTYSLYVNLNQPGHTSLVAGQRQALFITGAGTYENNADLVFAAFERLRRPHLSVNAGELYIGSCTTPDNMDAAIKAQMVTFARKITS
jgi:multimeric flavodoxin WrbA